MQIKVDLVGPNKNVSTYDSYHSQSFDALKVKETESCTFIWITIKMFTYLIVSVRNAHLYY